MLFTPKRAILPAMLLFALTVSAQRNANVGVFGGVSYYMGDINPNRHFYRPAPAFGGLYRYNINTRYSIRANGYYARLAGNDADFPDIYRPDRPANPASFSTSLVDLSLQIEFNFFPHIPNLRRWDTTPYLTTGISGALVTGSDAGAQNFLSIPMGIGMKTTLTKRLSAGAEFAFRKSFSDNIDGVANPSDIRSSIHNNDWYSFMGVFITYKFFNFAAGCPAYE